MWQKNYLLEKQFDQKTMNLSSNNRRNHRRINWKSQNRNPTNSNINNTQLLNTRTTSFILNLFRRCYNVLRLRNTKSCLQKNSKLNKTIPLKKAQNWTKISSDDSLTRWMSSKYDAETLRDDQGHRRRVTRIENRLVGSDRNSSANFREEIIGSWNVFYINLLFNL